jgi:hypothetical protein
MTEATGANKVPLELGQITKDGVYAGLTADGKQQIFAMPKDLDVLMTFNDAAKAVEELNTANSFGHNDWQIPTLENLHVLQKNRKKGKLKGTFNTTDKRYADVSSGWYWSSTESPADPDYVDNVRFSNGDEIWYGKDSWRLSCRPVRLLPVAAPSLG